MNYFSDILNVFLRFHSLVMIKSFFWVTTTLTGVQLEKQLDSEVVEVAAVLDDLDEWGQATLA